MFLCYIFMKTKYLLCAYLDLITSLLRLYQNQKTHQVDIPNKLKNPTLVFFSKKNMFCYLLFQYLKQIRP
jgi:fucose permease